MLKYIGVNAKNSKDWIISSQVLYKRKVQRPGHLVRRKKSSEVEDT